jgi:MoaA/NifB/PqqE/SkfB family radical SAM enzyme
MLQQDIDQGRFTWCAVEHCGIKHNDIDHGMYELAINIDESCNLSCASCRRDTIMHTTGAVVEKKQQDMQRILEWLEDFDRPLHVVTSGNGDPLASVVMRKFLQNYQPRPAQFWTMFTNGLLIKKQLERLPVLAAIKNFRISVDAARADTYARVRRGGHWPTLMENFEFLQNFDGDFEVTVNFCVQQANYQEIPEFIALCQTHGFKPHIHELDDWGTWDRFHEHNVLDLRHPDHVACRNIVESSLGKNHKRRWFFSTRLLELLSLT